MRAHKSPAAMETWRHREQTWLKVREKTGSWSGCDIKRENIWERISFGIWSMPTKRKVGEGSEREKNAEIEESAFLRIRRINASIDGEEPLGG